MTDRNVPATEGAADDRELTRLMAGLPGMVYRASAQPPFALEIVGGGYERIFGRSAEELVGKSETIKQTMHSDDASHYVEIVTAAVDRREPFHLEYRLLQPDGTERVVWEQGRPIVMPDGRLVIEGSIVDIEGPVRARQVQEATYRISQAAVSGESLQELYVHIHHIIAELMPSENLYLALRDPKTGFITYPYYIDEYDVVPPDPQMGETGLTAHILRTGTPLLLSEFSEADPVKSGSVTPTGTSPISWLGVPLWLKGTAIGVIAVQVYHGTYRYTDQDRNILSFVADQIAVSIDRWRSHDALATSEERFRIAAQSTSDIVYVWDTVEDRCTYYGDVDGDLARAIGGLPSKGSQWDLYVHPDDLPVLQQAIQEHLRTHTPLRVTYRMRCTDGTWRTIVDSSQVVLDKDGNVVKRIGTDTDITDRVAAENSLRDSEARMRALFAAMNDVIVILDRNGRCLEAVPTGALPQYSVDGLVGRNTRDVFAPEAAQAILCQVEKALSEHVTTEVGFSRDIAGSPHWLEVHISPLTDERVLLITHDATARHDARETARTEASKAETYFNTSGVIMEVTDMDLRLVRLNQTGYDFFGYTPDEIVGKDWLDIRLPERERDRIKALIRSELEGGFLPRSTENPVVTRSGEERIVAWHDSLLRDAEGRVTGLISSGVDVTDRVHAEHALQASELKFKELFNQAQDAILLHVINADGTMGPFIEANDIACHWTGYMREELMRLTLSDIAVDATPGTRERRIQRLMDQGKATFSVELKTRDGHRIPAEVSASSFTLEGRTVVLSIVRDITERLRLEHELQRMDKLESLGTLAGGIAHDFNNMMTGIVGNINLARIEDDADQSHELLEEAEREVLQARGLTQQLLTFAKGGAPVRSVQDLAHILREAVSFALRGSDVSASFDVPADLSWVDVDSGQIGQVFSNIAINADEAMPDGGTLLVSARNVTFVDPVPYPDLAPGNYLRIDLSDTGIGIAEANLRKIFDPFFSTKRRGSGLGLATSYAIVRKHDGYISVVSTPGTGTTFSIFLPAAPAGAAPQSRETNTGFSGHGRVLVMDDELTVRRVVVAMLKRLGYEAEAVPDGVGALRADAEASAAGRPFSIILMDLTIPGGMGGQEAAALLRENRTPAWLIASSGYATDPIMAHYREYNFDAVLAKPYSFTELTSVLTSLANQPSILGIDA